MARPFRASGSFGAFSWACASLRPRLSYCGLSDLRRRRHNARPHPDLLPPRRRNSLAALSENSRVFFANAAFDRDGRPLRENESSAGFDFHCGRGDGGARNFMRMKSLGALLLFGCIFAGRPVVAIEVSDDFNSSQIDTNIWQKYLGFANSSATETNGYATIRNGAELVTWESFAPPFEITGRLRFRGAFMTISFWFFAPRACGMWIRLKSRMEFPFGLSLSTGLRRDRTFSAH